MDIILSIIFVLFAGYFIINTVSNNFKQVSTSYLWQLFGVHCLLSIIYFLYAATSGSDSWGYYIHTTWAQSWASTFGTGTTSMHFFAWPFIRGLGLSFMAVMIIFAFLGFVGILFFYLVAKENIELKPKWNNYSYLELLFLLPNLHFWSASLGKGSTILFGLALFVYGLSRFNRRIPYLFIGGFIVYMIRPHILFTMILAIIVGLLFTRSGIKGYVKWISILLAAVIFYFISDSVQAFAKTDSLNILASSSLNHRVSELSKSNSGVDIENYNILMKLFTFWFRPLFFDGLGALGFIVSFENLLYLIMLFIILKEGIQNWRHWNGFFRICTFFFLMGSIILAQVSGNLGIAMRQKAQVMPFFFIIFCKVVSYRIELQEEETV